MPIKELVLDIEGRPCESRLSPTDIARLPRVDLFNFSI